LKGEFTRDRVIVPAVDPVDARTLIVELRGSELREGSQDGELLPDPGATKPVPHPIRYGLAHPFGIEKKR
jgi:hypothetical protein